MPDNEMLKQFDEKYLPSLVTRLLPLWNVPGESEAFNRRYVEMIIRTNMHENDLQFMLTDDGETCSGGEGCSGEEKYISGEAAGTEGIQELKAIAFGATKGDKSDDGWFSRLVESASAREGVIFENGRRYLNYMEEKTFSLMSPEDVKLCLFVSLETGWGSRILSEAVREFKSRGYKNMFLWTDCECNVQWYFDNGWELLCEEEYEPFSTGSGDGRTKYMTYIFKKPVECG